MFFIPRHSLIIYKRAPKDGAYYDKIEKIQQKFKKNKKKLDFCPSVWYNKFKLTNYVFIGGEINA